MVGPKVSAVDYPSQKADALERYVRKTFSLSATARHLYAALRWLEIERSGLCRPVFAGHRDLAEVAAIDIKSVKRALLELQTSGLCDVTMGRPIKAEKRATSVRRRTLDEIKARFTQGDDEAHRLAQVLTATSFTFAGKIVKPCWTVGQTGRVFSSKPNFQGTASAERMAGLEAGLNQGQCLVHADIRQAEPTITKYLLGIPCERDLYREYMDAAGCPRADAKKAVNTLAYCKNTRACFDHWPTPAKNILGDYADQLATYKATLFAESQRTRCATTLTGRSILAEGGRRLHPGITMNWRVQGTVADIVNGACLRLLECARTVLPVHDAVYAVVTSSNANFVEAVLIETARGFGLTIQVKAEVRHAC